MAGSLALQFRQQVEELLTRELLPVEVAVLDSGIDATHPDLAGRVKAAYNVSMAEGRAVVHSEPLTANHDAFGHGTAVASIIARQARNAELVDFQVLGADNTGSGEALVASLEYALTQGCRVINMSLAAKAEFAPRLSTLCDQAYRNGQVIVAAKRNMPLCDFGFPAEFTSVIAVDRGNFPNLLRLSYRPNQVVEFVGHGDEVVVAVPEGGYTTKTGTSFATPSISGIVALLLGVYPDLRPFDVKSILRALAE
jgi:subtilisin family serine protease